MLATVSVLAAVALLVGPEVAGAGRTDDPRAERDRVRSERAEVASQVDALRADRAEVDRALRELDANVRSRQAQLADAERAVEEADQRVERSRRELAEAEERFAALREQMVDFAIDAYVEPDTNLAGSVLESENIAEAATREALGDLRAGDDADLSDQLRAVRSDLAAKRTEAEEAAQRAEQRRAEVDQQVQELRTARRQQSEFAADVQVRINRALDRSVQLARTDRELSTRIALEAAAELARIRESQIRAERERQRRAAAERERASRDSAPEAADLPPADLGPISVGADLCSSGGITVSCAIVDSLSAMLEAAAADGVSLTGSGWRDPARQVALRRAHCGSSYYAIYVMSPGSCSPPTARPGTSMHEVGLAIDFRNCSGRGTACFGWLSSNASRFGFFNLPSEPWHWSTTGT